LIGLPVSAEDATFRTFTCPVSSLTAERVLALINEKKAKEAAK
jgi:NifU-like protein involved in Fe-S cluster formation